MRARLRPVGDTLSMARKLFFTTGGDGRLVVTHARPDGELDRADPLQRRAADTADTYREQWGSGQVLDWFEGQNGVRYLFDSTPDGATDLTRPANRVVAAWGLSRPHQRIGDRRMVRRFPLPRRADQAMDRGHLVALATGGGENVNLLPQATRLNRGWSDEGRRWRALERTCASREGVRLFIAVTYADVNDVPSAFEVRVQVPGETEVIEHFTNADRQSGSREPKK